MRAQPHPALAARADPLPALRHQAGLCFVVVALPTAAAAVWAEAAPGFSLKVGAASLAALWLVLRSLPAHLPHARFGGANCVTFVRLLLTAVLIGFIGEPGLGSDRGIAWAVAGVAAASASLDALDGPLARRHGTESAFGARFDLESDALLVLVLCGLAVQSGKAGPWMLAAGLMRYAFVAAARALPWLGAPLPPSRRRKAVCALLVAALVACLLPVVAPPWSHALAACALVAVTASFGIDLAWLRARRAAGGAAR